MNKEIEEMASQIPQHDIIIGDKIFYTEIIGDALMIAKTLYNAGYRKCDCETCNIKITTRNNMAREIFREIYSNLKYDGHTISIWKNNILNIAKQYGVDLTEKE